MEACPKTTRGGNAAFCFAAVSVRLRRHRVGARAVYRARRVLRRRVDGVNFERLPPRVHEVVVSVRGYDERPAVAYRLAEIHVVRAVAHQHQPLSLLHADELVEMRVHLKADVLSGAQAHQRELQVLSRPHRGAVIVVAFGLRVYVQCVGPRAVVLLRHRLAFEAVVAGRHVVPVVLRSHIIIVVHSDASFRKRSFTAILFSRGENATWNFYGVPEKTKAFWGDMSVSKRAISW